MTAADFDPTAVPNPVVELDSDAARMEESEERISEAFRRHAARDTIGAQHTILNALAAEVRRLLEVEPDLSELEKAIVAKRLLKQRIVICLGQLDQLL